jgi:hypothetical protein
MADWVVFDCVILGFLWYCVDICSGWELEFLVLCMGSRSWWDFLKLKPVRCFGWSRVAK